MKVKRMLVVSLLVILGIILYMIVDSLINRQEILKVALTDAMSFKSIDFSVNENNEVYALDSRGIGNNILILNDKKIIFFSEKELAEKVKSEGNFVYIKIDYCHTFLNIAEVSISYKATDVIEGYGGTVICKYHKINGKWSGEIINSIVS